MHVNALREARQEKTREDQVEEGQGLEMKESSQGREQEQMGGGRVGVSREVGGVSDHSGGLEL